MAEGGHNEGECGRTSYWEIESMNVVTADKIRDVLWPDWEILTARWWIKFESPYWAYWEIALIGKTLVSPYSKFLLNRSSN